MSAAELEYVGVSFDHGKVTIVAALPSGTTRTIPLDRNQTLRVIKSLASALISVQGSS